MPRLTPLLIALALLAGGGCAGTREQDPSALARTYAAAGRYQEAAREMEIAVRSEPRDAELRRRAASYHAEAGAVERAVQHLEVATGLAPSNPEIWIQLGELELGRENVTDAYVAYRRADELAPDDIRAVRGLALTAESLGNDEEAREAYARWAELEREQGDGAPASPER